jgi:hypothetical protein
MTEPQTDPNIGHLFYGVKAALEEHDIVLGVSRIEGEPSLGVEMVDGSVYLVTITPAN